MELFSEYRHKFSSVMINMDLNLQGRVRNVNERLLSKEPLMPVYEAVINSIHAIKESGREDGKIIIKIIREETADGKKSIHTPIKNFKILDNGIGFNDKNYEAFHTSDTDNKVEYGGKGIGRFTWLKAFERVEIKSVFSKEGKKLERIFKFTLEGEISEHEIRDTDKSIQTSVKLINFKERYREKIDKNPEKIAQKILEHFLTFYILEDHISVMIYDETKVEPISLGDLYNELKENLSEEIIKIEETDFKIFHLNLKKPNNNKNKIVYCAHSREVEDDKINFSGKQVLTDNTGSKFYYSCYVISDYLDKNIDNSRQTFSIPNKDKEITNFFKDSNISLESIKREVEKRIKKHLEPVYKEIEEKKEEILESFSKNNPHAINTIKTYKNDILEEIKVTDNPKRVNEIFYKYKGKTDFENRQEIDKVLATDKDEKDLNEKIKKVYNKLQEQEKDKLIEYMIYRHLTIELFRKKIEVAQGESISKEEVIHNIIFPMKEDSDSVDEEKVNLWLLDEKLVFHRIAYSDKEMNKIMDGATSKEAPDIVVVCKETQGVSVRSVAIFELKRPFTTTKDPIQQLFKYVKQIREHKKFKGVPLRVVDETLYYCYAVCDIDNKIKTLASNYGLTPLPFGIGYFTFNRDYNAFLEIRSYDEIYNDVVRRHRSFFDKLGLKYGLE